MLEPSELAAPCAEQVLHEVFGYAAFRVGQREAIDANLAGRDAIVLLPTGGGKSVCFQVPAIMHFRAGRGTTIVVSPLIALMNDQVAALRGRGVAAAALHSHQDEATQRELIAELRRGELALLYVSPERAALASFQALVARLPIASLAIDEAHCVSQWGHDFRPEYMQLHGLRRVLGAPVLAVTATATPQVMREIETGLALREPLRVAGDFWRPNLAFSVVHAASDATRQQLIMRALTTLGLRDKLGTGRAIIYCSTRGKVESVAEALRQHGFAVGYYHAGRTALARERAERGFAGRKTRVLVATNAFGMGIDYPDVRLVAHFQAPASLEAYYQEAGRAGRDGDPAACLMLFGPGDLVTHRRMQQHGGGGAGAAQRQQLALAAIERYANGEGCRQQAFFQHFTARTTEAACGLCDVCTGTVEAASDDTVDAGRASRRAPRPRATPKTKPSPAPRKRLARGTQRITGVKFDLDTFRKQAARKLRWKPYMVLQQGVIAAIDQARPASLDALARIPGLGPAKIARFGAEILAIVARNRQ